MTDPRLTIIARDARKRDIDWNDAPRAGEATAFIDSARALRSALAAASELGLDVGRVIIDRAGTPEEFLELLAALPPELTGDVLLIRDDGSGVMSATARGGGRVLYGLNAHDVRFYLETYGLVTGRVVLSRVA